MVPSFRLFTIAHIFYSTNAINKWHCKKIFNNKSVTFYSQSPVFNTMLFIIFTYRKNDIVVMVTHIEQLFLFFQLSGCMEIIMMLLWVSTEVHDVMFNNVYGNCFVCWNHQDPWFMSGFAWQKRQLNLKWKKNISLKFWMFQLLNHHHWNCGWCFVFFFFS